MSKRSADEIESAEQAYIKRQKISNPVLQDPGTTTHIGSAIELRQLLTFNQDSHKSIQNIQSFKLFLDSLAAAENNTSQIAILKDFLESQKNSVADGDSAVFLPDLIQTWSFASHSNNEKLLSAAPAVLALLLRILSSRLELSSYGLRLGKTLLLKEQQQLIGRGLLASKNKEFIISPVLRLLRELSIVDGGVLANNIFRARNQTFKGLIRNLTLRFTGDGEENIRKPSVRTNAIRFIIQLIKYLPVDSKRDLLNQRDVISALTRDIKDDPPFLIRDVLETLKTYIVKDDMLSRDAKTKVLTASLLRRIATLYRYNEREESLDPQKISIQDVGHQFLLFTCTSLNLGALLSQPGLYPKGLDPDYTSIIDSNDRNIDLGFEAIEWMMKYTENIPVRNVILSEFLKTLRPWSSIKQSELVLSTLRAAPELFAEYFLSKRDFSFDPKLSATWIGYSAFIYSAIQLPLPKYFGYHGKYANLPPPLSIVMEHILPQPLTLKVLMRCLCQSANSLITFSTTKILCAALIKLQDVLKMYQEACGGPFSMIWTQSASRILEKFSGRFPPISHIIIAYRRVKRTDLIQREALSKLISLYYKVLPCTAIDMSSGAQAALSQALLTIEEISLASQESNLRALELENVFSFANASPGIKWCSKGKGLPMSPFLAMLRLEALAPPGIPLLRLKSVLASVIEENQLLQTQTAISALDCLVMNLRSMMSNHELGEFYDFIDMCISRCATTPTKYIFKLEELYSENKISGNSDSTVSLLTLAMLEQWPYHIKAVGIPTLRQTATFISRHLAASVKIKENKKIIRNLAKTFIADSSEISELQQIIGGFVELAKLIEIPKNEHKNSDKDSSQIIEDQSPAMAEEAETEPYLDNHDSLTKWINKDLEEVIFDGHAASLVMLLSSRHLGIRKEASTNITKLAQKLKDSRFEEKDQIWLLLSELNETAKTIINQEPLPTILSVFGSYAIGVLKDPSHCLFPKINKFLLQGPIWQLNKIPLLHSIMDQAPSLDEAFISERKWLLSCLCLGLRSEADLALYRKRSVFEKLLSSYNAYLGQELQGLILKILAKASTINEGSTTLVTRFGVVTWLEVQEALTSSESFKKLLENLLGSCDRKRIRMWSKGTIETSRTNKH